MGRLTSLIDRLPVTVAVSHAHRIHVAARMQVYKLGCYLGSLLGSHFTILIPRILRGTSIIGNVFGSAFDAQVDYHDVMTPKNPQISPGIHSSPPEQQVRQ